MSGQGPKVVIVGGGHGGAAMAAALRQAGHEGEIVLLSDEPVLPYHRPPLSKAYLKDGQGEPTLLQPASFYERKAVEFCRDRRVVAIDRAAKALRCADGGSVTYDLLVLATGSAARRLSCPGAELGGVVTLRDLADAGALAAMLRPGRRLVIVGAGYVGLEVAASARALGVEVVVLEREPRILARVACEELSGFFQRYHAAHGVVFRTGASVVALHGEGGRVTAVELAGGERIACDGVLVGIGGSPRDELAAAAGLACDAGVIVDAAAQTSDPAIYAIGDLTRRPMPHYGNRLFRVESVPNATDQARAAAAAIVGKPLPDPELPWFWSDQYDLKLQIVGVPFDADQRIVRGSVDSGNSFSILHLAAGRVVAVGAVNAAADFVAGKKLILGGRVVAPERLADTDVPLKAWLALPTPD